MKRLCFIAFAIAMLSLSACGGADPTPANDKKAVAEPAALGTGVVVIETNKGTFKAELYGDKAPITVANFLKYVDKKHYDGTIFHRVIRGFMIQGGGFEPGMRGEKPCFPPIKNEAYNGLKNEKGTLAMARTPDPNSATAQFFVNVVDNDSLNRASPKGDGFGYAVFGKVVEGMDVVDEIRFVQTGAGDVPITDVLIKSIRREEAKKE